MTHCVTVVGHTILIYVGLHGLWWECRDTQTAFTWIKWDLIERMQINNACNVSQNQSGFFKCFQDDTLGLCRVEYTT